MFTANVETTLLLRWIAVAACFASSLIVRPAAAMLTPPDASNSLLLRLFFGVGSAVGFVAKLLRCCGSACLRRQARHVQGVVRRKKGESIGRADIMRTYLQKLSIEKIYIAPRGSQVVERSSERAMASMRLQKTLAQKEAVRKMTILIGLAAKRHI